MRWVHGGDGLRERPLACADFYLLTVALTTSIWYKFGCHVLRSRRKSDPVRTAGGERKLCWCKRWSAWFPSYHSSGCWCWNSSITIQWRWSNSRSETLRMFRKRGAACDLTNRLGLWSGWLLLLLGLCVWLVWYILMWIAQRKVSGLLARVRSLDLSKNFLTILRYCFISSQLLAAPPSPHPILLLPMEWSTLSIRYRADGVHDAGDTLSPPTDGLFSLRSSSGSGSRQEAEWRAAGDTRSETRVLALQIVSHCTNTHTPFPEHKHTI